MRHLKRAAVGCTTQFLCAIALTCAALGTAHAARYEISGDIEFQVPAVVLVDSYDLSGGVSMSRQIDYDNSPAFKGRAFLGRAGSGADRYGLHASTFAAASHIANGDDGGVQFMARSFVRVIYTDVVIDGPLGAGPVATPINFHLLGEQILGTHSPGPLGGFSTQSSVFLQIFAGANSDFGVSNVISSNGINAPLDRRGMLVGFDGDTALATSLFTLPVNTPFTLDLSLGVSAFLSVAYREGYITSALSDFGGTLSFATDRPVFDLPAGYSAHSVDADIVNNAFASAVPEPGGGALVALGLAFMGGWSQLRRRWQRQIAAATSLASLA